MFVAAVQFLSLHADKKECFAPHLPVLCKTGSATSLSRPKTQPQEVSASVPVSSLNLRLTSPAVFASISPSVSYLKIYLDLNLSFSLDLSLSFLSFSLSHNLLSISLCLTK